MVREPSVSTRSEHLLRARRSGDLPPVMVERGLGFAYPYGAEGLVEDDLLRAMKTPWTPPSVTDDEIAYVARLASP